MSERQPTYKPILVFFAGGMALVAILLNGITWSRVMTSIQDFNESRGVRNLWHDLLSSLKDAETGQRGYILSGKRDFAQPYDEALPRIENLLYELSVRAQGDPTRVAEVDLIRETVGMRLSLLDKVSLIRERDGIEAAIADPAFNNGKLVMDRLRELINRRVADRQAQVDSASAKMSKELRWGFGSALGAGVAALGAGIIAFVLLRDALIQAKREQRLAEEKRRAERSDREKSSFLATMSHEIRTPMNAILGFAELLRDRVTEDRDLRYVDSILAGGHSLLQLINDILDLSKVEAGMLELNPEPTDLRATAQFIRQLFSQLAVQRGLEFRVDVDEEVPPSLLFDHLRLRQVLINVVGNAMKFTERGRVTLRIRGIGKVDDPSSVTVIVEVEDSGRGIPRDQIESIFRPFVQIDESARIPGTGLGLAIVQRLVRLMKGEISVESEVDRGTLFRFTFPGVRVTSRLAQPLSGATDEGLDFNDFRPSRILVADDNPTNLELMAGIFEDTHHTIIEVGDGKTAVEATFRETPDLILMDVRMPRLDGFAALEAIRSEGRFRLLPVIAVTASSLGGEDLRARRIFDGYIQKPFSRADLYSQMAQFVPRHSSDPAGSAPADEAGECIAPTAELAETWARLTLELEQMRVREWEPLVRTLAISGIEDFARRLEELAEAAHCPPLARYARDLRHDARSFSPDLLVRTLNRFPDAIGMIRQASTPSSPIP